MTQGPPARLFIALLPDNGVREQLAACRDAWAWPRSASPVKTERLHITLHFLGDVALERLPELAQALDVPLQPFTLHLSRANLWPGGIAVLEPETIPAALLALHGATASVLQRLGLPVDARPFRPHVTLARRANGAVFEHAMLPVSWAIDRYALMSSTLGTGGGYTVVKQY